MTGKKSREKKELDIDFSASFHMYKNKPTVTWARALNYCVTFKTDDELIEKIASYSLGFFGFFIKLFEEFVSIEFYRVALIPFLDLCYIPYI